MTKTYRRQQEIPYYNGLKTDIHSQMKEMIVGDRYRTFLIVWVNVYEFDMLWSRSSDYIGSDIENKKARDFLRMDPVERHKRFGRFELPAVKITVRGEVNVIDGRHRLAAMRDEDTERMPVCMDKNSAENAERISLGFILRNSREQS